METKKVYPSCCTSAFCGRLDCAGCKNLPQLEAFKAWVKKTGAEVSDPVWCPTVYVVKKK